MSHNPPLISNQIQLCVKARGCWTLLRPLRSAWAGGAGSVGCAAEEMFAGKSLARVTALVAGLPAAWATVANIAARPRIAAAATPSVATVATWSPIAVAVAEVVHGQ